MANPFSYITETDLLPDPALFPEAMSSVSDARREKILRMRRAEDRRLSLGAELLLNRALAEAGFVPERLTRAENPQGKPYIPEIASRFQYNLSHSGNKAMCVWTPAGNSVGCDIQEYGDLPLDLAKRFFHPDEYGRILSFSDPEEQRKAFYRYWALKESFIKCTGEGLSRPLNSFEIRIADHRISVFCPSESRNFCFGEPYAGEGYACAWCMES